MFFGQAIEKDPLSRVSLKNISFEPSRRPSGAEMLRYRESFGRQEDEQLFQTAKCIV